MAMIWSSLAIPHNSMQRVNRGPINSPKQALTALFLTTQMNQTVVLEMVRIFKSKLVLHHLPFHLCLGTYGLGGTNLDIILKKAVTWPSTLAPSPQEMTSTTIWMQPTKEGAFGHQRNSML